MFRFEHPANLYALALIPVLALLFALAWQWRRRAIRRFGEADAVAKLSPGFSPYKPLLKLSLWLGAIALLSIALANPQWGSKREKIKPRHRHRCCVGRFAQHAGS
jgi:Ca-activated chloride channel family protein